MDLPSKTLTLGGTTYSVASERALRWVQILTERPGVWVSSRELPGLDRELQDTRTDKYKKLLPAPVLAIIESQTGGGSRILLGRDPARK